jgi:hypothetical protein
MSVNGKPNEGDVHIDSEGYMLCYLKNSNGCWYKLYLGPASKGDMMWLSEASLEVYPSGESIMNIKDLLLSVRKELQDESSS